MNIRNTEANYGLVAKTLHWVTAALFLGSYISVYYRHWFTSEGSPENWTALQLHLSIGISVAMIVVLRILWRIFDQSPELESQSKPERTLVHLGHYALYAVMIVAPLTGYLGTSVGTEFFSLFEIPMFEETGLFTALVTDTLGMSFEAFEEPVDFIHKSILGEWLVWVLVAGHVAAALYHHFVKQDRTLKKMTNGAP